MKKNITKPTSKERINVIMSYALMLLDEGKENIAERYKNREHMTLKEVELAKEHAAYIRDRQKKLMRGT
ncbi:MAG: hypothetical protein ABSE71_02005 [Candidatus Micrarchaeaceae archaeon]|jgi:hypothetical protein|nr:hypothetical protein [Candidatus Micrarchaeota archaeon]HII09812.1 hypothetical protein [Candidatus Micrarchaeota archaeon]